MVNTVLQSIMESLLLVLALSLDSFIASFAYGTSNIKIPFKCTILMSAISSGILALSLCLGALIKPFIPGALTTFICFATLMILGIIKFFNHENVNAAHTRVLSMHEAAPLALALSLDGLAAGFGAGLTSINYMMVIIFSLIAGILAVLLGSYMGRKISKKISFNLSWLSGLMLIILAILKLT